MFPYVLGEMEEGVYMLPMVNNIDKNDNGEYQNKNVVFKDGS